MRVIPGIAWKWVTEIGRSFRLIAGDLRAGHRFWVPVVCGLLPIVVAAMAVSSNNPRLTVQLSVHDVTYVTRQHPIIDRQRFSLILNLLLRDQISSQLKQLFPLPPDANAEEKNKPAVTDKSPKPQNKDEKQELRDNLTPSPTTSVGKEAAAATGTPVVANQGGDPAPPPRDFFVRVASKIRVTNIGSLSSTVRSVGMYIVEEIDGRRETWEMHVENELDIKLPQGQAAEIGGEPGKTVLFWKLSKVFMDYETVRLVGEKLGALKPKEKNLYADAVPFLQLLGEDPQEKERLVRIANPKVSSRLLLVVEVWDIYGRRGSAETDLMNSHGWMAQSAESVQK